MNTLENANSNKLAQGEIQARLAKFVKDHANDCDEMRDYVTFWDDLFRCYGTLRQHVAIYQYSVPKMSGNIGKIDLLWKQTLLVEQKSLGKDLDAAFVQAHDYMTKLPANERPLYLVVSDFHHFRLYDLASNARHDFTLSELPERWQLLSFIGGYQPKGPANDVEVDFEAVRLLSSLYDKLKDAGYPDHQLQRFLVRILFCLFAEDTAIFPCDAFADFIRHRTNEDGTDLGLRLEQFFRVLNTPDEDPRRRALEPSLATLPYVNGGLFKDHLEFATTNAEMRQQLLVCAQFDWSKISPAIFGSLFQGVMDTRERRTLGAHYTSEEHILRVIRPLFLDSLRSELDLALADRSQRRVARLTDFHQKLERLKFLDPACGCGNFLIISYRELRRLEHEVLLALYGKAMSIDIRYLSRVRLAQFVGIEIAEFPSEIARVAMWLMDHVMNSELSRAFGKYFLRLPLVDEARITHGNALQLDWNAVLPAPTCSYVFGNPPFVGKKEQTPEQKADVAPVFAPLNGSGVLDLVAGWYIKAANYLVAGGGTARAAFVSTSSITQGEQVGVLWRWMLANGIRIHFAHRAFGWTSEARGKASVHCVIIGFGCTEISGGLIYEYEDLKAEPRPIPAHHINPYLTDAADLFIDNRRNSICSAPPAVYGSFALDGGHYTLDEKAYASLLESEPGASQFLRPFIGGEELINGGKRWCLWLKDASPAVLKAMPAVMERVEAVRNWRSSRERETTRKLAATPTLFAEVRQPETDYIAIPTVSSERRIYLPIGFLNAHVVASNQLYVVANAKVFEFGVLTSAMHNAWVRAICGRLESRYRYSAGIVYNNFPWPTPTEKQRTAIEAAAQAVLDARAAHPDASLADLYDPLTMPPELVKAHQVLDAAVDAAYGFKRGTSDAARVAFLFTLYQQYTTLFPAEKVKTRVERRPV